MKRLFLMLAMAASVAAAAPLAAPAFARDGDQPGRAERSERQRGGGPPPGRGWRRGEDSGERGSGARRYEPRGYPAERGGPPPRMSDDRRRSVPALGYGDTPPRRYDERPRYEETRPRRGEARPRYGEGASPRARGFAPAPPAYGARRGGYLPRNFSGEIVDDYRRYRLRTPPAGFAWVRMGRGFALVSMRDGQIFDMVQ